eukprot:1159138-Pelagomonas_calceolata.AAC.6
MQGGRMQDAAFIALMNSTQGAKHCARSRYKVLTSSHPTKLCLCLHSCAVQIDAVLSACKHKSIVRALFSATLPEKVEDLARWAGFPGVEWACAACSLCIHLSTCAVRGQALVGAFPLSAGYNCVREGSMMSLSNSRDHP